jgi:hypothetical protein
MTLDSVAFIKFVPPKTKKVKEPAPTSEKEEVIETSSTPSLKVPGGIEEYSDSFGGRGGKRVVLFGEATFDFARQYAERPGHGTYRIVATEYRSLAELQKMNLGDALRLKENIDWLRAHGVIVLFGVDATNPGHWQFIKTKYFGGSDFEKVQWNDPHTSAYGQKDQEEKLMGGFFSAAEASLPTNAKLKLVFAGWPYLSHPGKDDPIDIGGIAGSKSFTPKLGHGSPVGVTGDKYTFAPQRTIGGDISEKLTYNQLKKQSFTRK